MVEFLACSPKCLGIDTLRNRTEQFSELIRNRRAIVAANQETTAIIDSSFALDITDLGHAQLIWDNEDRVVKESAAAERLAETTLAVADEVNCISCPLAAQNGEAPCPREAQMYGESLLKILLSMQAGI